MRNFAFWVAAFSLVAGCGNKEAQLAGKWNGKVDSVQFAKVASGIHVELELKSDHTFAMHQNGEATGSWSFKENVVDLKMLKAAGKDLPAGTTPDFNLTLTQDGKTLTGSDPTGKSDIKFTFTKVTS